MTEILDAMRGRTDAAGEIDELGRVMAATSACVLGLAAPLVTVSLMRYWPDEVTAHIQGRCTTGECP